MSFTFPGSIADNVYNEKKNTKNHLMRALAEAYDQSIVPNSWEHIQFLVRNGLHNKVLHIGDELTCRKGNEEIVWQIVDFDNDIPADPQFTHSLTLMMKNVYSTELQYDAREAFYVADSTLVAGTYNMLISSQPYYSSDEGKYIQFTLTESLPADGQLVFTHNYNTTVIGTNIKSYGSNSSTTEIETCIVSEGQDGTYLGELTSSVQININSSYRSLRGNNDYEKSAIRQWLNSNKNQGNIWIPQNEFDRPPNWINSIDGFLKDVDSDFIKVIGNSIVYVTTDVEIEKIPPFKFYGDGQPLKNWEIYGNSGGVGERTKNLFDKNSYSENGFINDRGILTDNPSYPIRTFDFIQVRPNQRYSYKAYSVNGATIRINYYTRNKTFISRHYQIQKAENIEMITTPRNCEYISLSIDENIIDYTLLTEGTTVPIEYEPYGYKIPVTCGGETTNIYIGKNHLGDNESITFSEKGTEIPTINGQNTLTVNTTIQPEKVKIELQESTIELKDKIFLPSKTQVYGDNNERQYAYYKNYSSLNGADTISDSNRIKIKNNLPNGYWLRNPAAIDGDSSWSVDSIGQVVNNKTVDDDNSISAACTIY